MESTQHEDTKVATEEQKQDKPVEQKKKEEKKGAGKDDRDKKKAERLAARQAKTQESTEYKKDPNDSSAHLFGDLELNRSQSDPEQRYARKFTAIKDLDESLVGQEVLIRGRLHGTRVQSKKIIFLTMREQFATVQAALFVSEGISQGMAEYARRIPKESIVDIKAKVVVPEHEVHTCSISKIELHIKEVWTVNKSAPILPFQLEDASHKVENQEDEDKDPEQLKKEKAERAKKEKEEGKEEHKGKGKHQVHAIVGQDIRLNNRIIDLRVPSNQALMRIQSGVCQLFRDFLLEKDFIEIHSPKLIGGTSEGGANVFRLDYFGQEACLAQSPQLAKQMVLCGDMQRVFEIGPVFRAEHSYTNRHLCEFTGLDIEMVFNEHYFEILDLLADLFVHIFNGLETKYAKELKVVQDQYYFEPFKCKTPVVRLNFKDAIKLLHENNINQEPLEDLSTETEKALGKLVREKYDTDFYMLYGYPVNARPFYTMLDPHDSNYTNSYDFFMRGEEITSGAQRVHDPEFLAERAVAKGIPVPTIQDYIDSFKYGAPPHGGCGIGLERVVKFYCGISNIRKCTLFPRDPKRLRP